ncbi:cupin domain-containing protein [Pseudaminobacter sp. NGMCC 1.201702]|uniref:cupin domain-containing protein n=1 Tax=Pseudaminobacter sp. NGMCC 1.201702 TaxID=3391825 RepID=UPI0039F1375B
MTTETPRPSMVHIREANAEKVTTNDLSTRTDGNPVHDSWPVFKSVNEKVRSGIWQSSAGAWVTEISGYTEFCYIIEGEAQVTDQDGNVNHITAGDAFVMPDGFTGRWEVAHFVRKYFVIADT